MGCEEIVDLSDQFDGQPKLVLYCRLCPQLDSTYIVLTTSNVLYNKTTNDNPYSDDCPYEILKNGVVELSSDGKTWKKAAYDQSRQQFLITQSDFPIREGYTYHIRASHEGYPGVSASCTVPYIRPVNFHFDTVTVQSDVHWGEIWNEEHQDLYAEWSDYPGEQNYYMLARNFFGAHCYNGEIMYKWVWYLPGLEDDKKNYLKVFSDEGKDGQLIRGLMEGFFEFEEDTNYKEQYYLFFLDKNCYMYEKTCYNSDYSEFSSMFLEPLHTYNNIENGYGLFGAFSMQGVR